MDEDREEERIVTTTTNRVIIVTVLGTHEQVSEFIEKHAIRPEFVTAPGTGGGSAHPVTVVEVEDSEENRTRVKAFGADFFDHLLSVAVTTRYLRKAEPLW